MINDTHYKEGKKVTFKKYDLNMAGLLFFPKDFDENKKYPAIVTVHPGGGVKEQCSSLYSWNLSQHGYIALAFDDAPAEFNAVSYAFVASPQLPMIEEITCNCLVPPSISATRA